MTAGLQLILLAFALVAYGGAGASFAVARFRRFSEGERDLGMIGVAVMLFLFGALCTIVGVGLSGVLAFGGVILLTGYVLMAQHMGLFRIESTPPPRPEEERTEETRKFE